MNWLPLMAGLLGMSVVFLIMPLILTYSRQWPAAQRSPDLHHTNTAPVCRLGGIALAAAFFILNIVGAVLVPEHAGYRRPLVILGTSLAMFALGLWDDLRPLGARKKLLGHVLIASGVVCFGMGIATFRIPFSGRIVDLGSWGILITVLWLVSMTNLINLIDGVDGLAGGISFMLMALLAYVGHHHGNFDLLASGMAGALLAFLWFNFPPARIYLGDGGAYFLGFQIGLLALIGSHKGTVLAALVAPLFVLALPIVDMVLAIVRRGLRGLPIFRPDRKHIHHRLLEMGFSRRQAVLSLYALTLVFLLMGFLAFLSGGELVPALLGISLLILLLCAGKLNFSREWFAVGRVLGNSLEMRQEIQYALSLTKWLSLEGRRHPSIDSLWSDLIFVVQRLGFTSVVIELPDKIRAWKWPENVGTTLTYLQQLRGVSSGTIQLQAPARPLPTIGANQLGPSPPISDPKLFEIVSDLVAEGWLKAATSWAQARPSINSEPPRNSPS